MSSYQGRTGPNVSQLLSDLNTSGYGSESVVTTDFTLNDDLAIFANTDFTNTDFTDFDIPLSDTDGLNFDLDPSTINSTPFYGSYNTPIQPAPPTTLPSSGPQLPINSTSPTPSSASSSLKRKADALTPTNPSPEEQARLAAEEDKRRRNTAASARFRVKKKQREQNLEKTVKEVNEKNSTLEKKIAQLETENKFLRGLITEKNGTQSKEQLAEAFQQFRKESEERDLHVEQKNIIASR